MHMKKILFINFLLLTTLFLIACSPTDIDDEEIEKFSFQIKTGHINDPDSKKFTIPLAGAGSSSWQPDGNMISVWNIDWGDGKKEEAISVSNDMSTFLYRIYEHHETIYTITIEPVDKSQKGWFRPFGFNSFNYYDDAQSRWMMYKLLTPLTKTGGFFDEPEKNNYVYSLLFQACENMTMGNDFTLPEGVKEVGDSFMEYTFDKCFSLKMGESFNIPTSLIKVGNDFMRNTFSFSGIDSMNSIFNIPEGLSIVGNNFMYYTFFYTPLLTMNNVFSVPESITSVPDRFLFATFAECENLEMGEGFSLPNNLNSVGVFFMHHTFRNCISLTTNMINSTRFELIYVNGVNNETYASSTFLGCINVDVSQLNGFIS